MEPWQLTASAAAAQLRDGTLTAEALTRSCLERIAEREPVTKAFSYLDPVLAISQRPQGRQGLYQGRAARPAARREGHDRHRRHADQPQLADLRRPAAGPRCRLRRAWRGARAR